jgi:hypothetical protein
MFLKAQRAALFLDDDQEAAMQDAELLASCPALNKQRLERYGQIGNCGSACERTICPSGAKRAAPVNQLAAIIKLIR